MHWGGRNDGSCLFCSFRTLMGIQEACVHRFSEFPSPQDQIPCKTGLDSRWSTASSTFLVRYPHSNTLISYLEQCLFSIPKMDGRIGCCIAIRWAFHYRFYPSSWPKLIFSESFSCYDGARSNIKDYCSMQKLANARETGASQTICSFPESIRLSRMISQRHACNCRIPRFLL